MACPVSGHSGKWEEGHYEGTQHATSAPGGQIRCRRKHLMKVRVWRLVYLKLWAACTLGRTSRTPVRTYFSLNGPEGKTKSMLRPVALWVRHQKPLCTSFFTAGFMKEGRVLPSGVGKVGTCGPWAACLAF